MLQGVIIVLLVAESVYSAKAMGIGRFARTFPCDEKNCPLSAKFTGCTKTPIINETQAGRNPATNQSTSGHAVHQTFSNKQDMLNTSSANHSDQFAKTALEMSINYTTFKLGSDNHGTSEHPASAPSQPNIGSPYYSKEQGYTKTPTLNYTQAERNPAANQSTFGHFTHEPFSNKQDILSTSAPYQAVKSSEAVLQISVNYTTSSRKCKKCSTTEHPSCATATDLSSVSYPNSTKEQRSTATPVFNDTERNSTSNLPSNDHATHEPFRSQQHTLNTLTTDQAVQISANYATTQDVRDKGATTEHPISTTAPCPPNMVYTYCTEGQGTCENPSGGTVTCLESMICVCPAGFLIKDNDCVPQEECECFIAGVGVLQNGETNVNADCTNRCECQSNILTCDDSYRCSSAATCEERDGVRQCYCDDGYKGNGTNCELDASDCADVYNAGFRQSGVYTIKPTNWPGSPFDAYCNMAHGGGWTVFQRRMDGSQDFYLGWNMYRDGFGSLDREFWIGNEKLYYITNNKNYELRIDLTDKYGSPYHAKYKFFRISNENNQYKLVGLGTFTGMDGYDALNSHRNEPFSTHDRDNDDSSSYNCAKQHRGGWWYDFYHIATNIFCPTLESFCDFWPSGIFCGGCADSNLNGDYDSSQRGKSIHWTGLPGYDCNIIYTEMKIKPI